jgi:large subunit ribosomal protein L1
VAKAVKDIKAGKIEYRVDDQGICHLAIGKIQFSESQIAENARTVLQTLVAAKPAASKGVYLMSAYLSSTMGPGIPLDTAEFVKVLSKD